jgi:hypothetical protein
MLAFKVLRFLEMNMRMIMRMRLRMILFMIQDGLTSIQK